MQSTSDYVSGCSTGYIHFQDFRRDLYRCGDGSCYARVLSVLDRLPVVVIYPEARAARLEAQAALSLDVQAAVRSMGDTLQERIPANDPGLQALEARVSSVVRDALAEADAIKQPVDETDDEQLQRLGLKPATRALVRGVLPS